MSVRVDPSIPTNPDITYYAVALNLARWQTLAGRPAAAAEPLALSVATRRMGGKISRQRRAGA